jgi:hypothetical protein
VEIRFMRASSRHSRALVALVVAAAIVLPAAGLAAASDTDTPPAEATVDGAPSVQEHGSRSGLPVTWLDVSFAVLQGLDLHSTWRAVGSGRQEVNPLIGGASGSMPSAIVLKAGMTTLTVWSNARLRRTKPGLARTVAVVENLVYLMIVTHNYRLGAAGSPH